MPEPLFVAIGGIHIGRNFINSFQASRPFGKIEVYDDRIVLIIQKISNRVLALFRLAGKIPFMPGTYNNIPREISLTDRVITGYKTMNLGPLGYGIAFLHSEDSIPPFLQIWLKRKDAKKIIEYLKKMKINFGN